ncbi:hypothetical protein [Pseudonocardia hydrocarbonoxydans]|uniref:hypothetical protein n=1 Tax=Pseudonocardia hydrocarbonoxydans TaxID=76726 RepID=UPI00351AAF0C
MFAHLPGPLSPHRGARRSIAFPGEDISDRPEPHTVVPAFLRLLDERPPSGRHRAVDVAVAR